MCPVSYRRCVCDYRKLEVAEGKSALARYLATGGLVRINFANETETGKYHLRVNQKNTSTRVASAEMTVRWVQLPNVPVHLPV